MVRRRGWSIRLGLVVAVVVLGAASGAAGAAGVAAPCSDQDLEPSLTPGIQARWERASLCLVNRERALRHRRALRLNRQLTAGALFIARRVPQGQFWSHTDPRYGGFERRLVRSGYPRGWDLWGAGENLAARGGLSFTPALAVQMWMTSPHHRENILIPEWREYGAGFALGTSYSTTFGWTAAQWFGERFNVR